MPSARACLLLGLVALAAWLLPACRGSVAGPDAGQDAAEDGGHDDGQDASDHDGLEAGDGQDDGDCGDGVSPADADGGLEPTPSLDLFCDQDFVVPADAQAGDAVGLVRLYPTLDAPAPVFSLAGGPSGLFVLEAATGELTLADPVGLSPGPHEVLVTVAALGGRDEAAVRVRVLPAAEVVYIDPGNAADPAQDGTRAHPLASWAAVTWRPGRAYLQRRGTVSVESQQVAIGADDVLLGAYGAGPRPVIDSSATHGVSAWRKAGIEVRELEVRSSDTSSMNWSSPTRLAVVGCRLQGGTWGMRFTGDPPPSGIRVLWTELFEVGDDGMFVQNAEDIELGMLDIHHVNTHWSPPETPETIAAGDAIQLHRVHRFHVHHSRLDRTSSGNKFCFIANECSQGLVEHNLMAGPLVTPVGGATVYLGGTPLTHSTVLRFNTFLGPSPTAIYSHAADLQVIGNLFLDQPRGVWTDGQASLWHNVFSGVALGVTGGGRVEVRNTIFHLLAPEARAFGSLGELSQDHNLFSRDPLLPGALVGDPLFVDAPGGDFRLQPGSPAIDQGVDLGLTEDRLGTPIPQGAAPDLGAFEHRPAP
jgi:hypothetical protein